ncbi:MAG: glycosyltransferase [Hymenobacteraceae bacterium]|nr:glycosyltransferase [Hymenobacteraceae bacterium]
MSVTAGSDEVDLSVIIVSFNVAYFLEQALLSVRRASDGLRVEVFVVDNASVDNSVAMTRERFAEVHVIANSDNVGFSRANNQALRVARGRYQLLLNPDTVVAEDTFRQVVSYLDAHPRVGGLGVMMLDGHGQFLPESKRGLPTPWVAFCKMFGLSTLFPRSRRFAGYHLGYLSPNQTHEVDVLSGAFMLLRKTALDQVGLLDEEYFMYGEDIDLSWRLRLGGWLNVYFPATRIIHYKGESTKRTSVNYVRVFYRAMVIFARKHFAPRYATTFGLLINLAIGVRAALAVARRLAEALLPAALDAALIFGGMVFLKQYWEANHKYVPGPYPAQYLAVAVPAYIGVWLLSAYLSGGYDDPPRAGRVARGVAVGTVLISAISNFLDAWRFSKALIVLGGVWAVAALVLRRAVMSYLRYGELRMGERRTRRLAVVGSPAEVARVQHLLDHARVRADVIGSIEPEDERGSGFSLPVSGSENWQPASNSQKPEARNAKPEIPLGRLSQLDEIISLYQLDEVIFCGRDLPSSRIIEAMVQSHQRPVEYKILPEASEYIIGSSSKNSPGDYYTLTVELSLYKPAQQRAQRLLNVLSAAALLALSPVLVWVMRDRLGFVRNCFGVLFGQLSWVGLRYEVAAATRRRRAVLSPADRPTAANGGPLPLDEATRRRLEVLYAKDYSPSLDLSILLRGFRLLGRAT